MSAGFHEGDLVEVRRGEESHTGRWHQTGIFGCLPNVDLDWDNLSAQCWTVKVIEKAAPKLPTTPGWYEAEEFPLGTEADFEPYSLRSDGEWFTADGMPLEPEDVRRQGNMRRLEPVADTAKRFAERLSEVVTARIMSNLYAHGTAKHILGRVDEIAAEFGVTE